MINLKLVTVVISPPADSTHGRNVNKLSFYLFHRFRRFRNAALVVNLWDDIISNSMISGTKFVMLITLKTYNSIV